MKNNIVEIIKNFIAGIILFGIISFIAWANLKFLFVIILLIPVIYIGGAIIRDAFSEFEILYKIKQL